MSRRRFFRRQPTPAPGAPPDGPADLLLDGYLGWRDASFGVRAAYERWARWESSDRHVAYASYLAALEHEERAARNYELQVEFVHRACAQLPGVGSLTEAAPIRGGP